MIIALDGCLLEVVWIVRTWFLNCLDQPNRRIRTNMSGGVGVGLCEEAPYPVSCTTWDHQIHLPRIDKEVVSLGGVL